MSVDACFLAPGLFELAVPRSNIQVEHARLIKLGISPRQIYNLAFFSHFINSYETLFKKFKQINESFYAVYYHDFHSKSTRKEKPDA